VTTIIVRSLSIDNLAGQDQCAYYRLADSSVTPAIGLSEITKPRATSTFVPHDRYGSCVPKMRPSLVSSSLFLITSFATTGTALEALSNSPCAVQCGNVLGSTSGNDIVCPDSSYTSTLAGQTFQSCISCQLASTYQDPVTKETDLQWALCECSNSFHRLYGDYVPLHVPRLFKQSNG
jgi:hypothetical protein